MRNQLVATPPISKSDILLGGVADTGVEDHSATALGFNEVFRNFKGMVFNLAFRMLGNREDALELTQEVFLAVYRKLGDFRGQSSLKTWMYRIVINKARNRLRWWHVRRRSLTCSLHDLSVSEENAVSLRLGRPERSPEDSLRGAEIEARFHRGLQQLPVNQRLVLIMRDVESLSYEEIAESLGVSCGTVKSRLARARERMRDLLGPDL